MAGQGRAALQLPRAYSNGSSTCLRTCSAAPWGGTSARRGSGHGSRAGRAQGERTLRMMVGSQQRESGGPIERCGHQRVKSIWGCAGSSFKGGSGARGRGWLGSKHRAGGVSAPAPVPRCSWQCPSSHPSNPRRCYSEHTTGSYPFRRRWSRVLFMLRWYGRSAARLAAGRVVVALPRVAAAPGTSPQTLAPTLACRGEASGCTCLCQ